MRQSGTKKGTEDIKDAPASSRPSTRKPVEELVAIDDELLAAIAKVKGHAVQKAVPRPLSEIYPVSAMACKNPVPGMRMPDGSIFLGKCNIMSKDFNILAAAEDLPKPMKYVETVDYIAKEYEAHGHGGGNYRTDKEFLAAVRSGRYDGSWAIPPAIFLGASEKDFPQLMPHSMHGLKEEGAFKGTFKMAARRGSPFASSYWSSTNDNDSSFMRIIDFRSGNSDSEFENHYRLNCRPIRLVPCS